MSVPNDRDSREQQARRELEEKLREALASGPATPMTREDWKALERKVWERHARDRPKP